MSRRQSRRSWSWGRRSWAFPSARISGTIATFGGAVATTQIPCRSWWRREPRLSSTSPPRPSPPASKNTARPCWLAWRKSTGFPFFYVNQVGGNDDLVFDGRSCVFDKEGRLVARAQGFEQDLIIADPACGEGSDRRGRFHSRVRDLAGSCFGHARLRAQVRLFRGFAGPFRGHRLKSCGGHSRFCSRPGERPGRAHAFPLHQPGQH